MRVRNEVDGFVHPQDGDVVLKGSGVELRMDLEESHVSFDVRVELDVVVDVPFAQTDSQVVRAVGLDAMSCRDDVLAVDQRASADVNRFLRVLFQNGHLPRIFTCGHFVRLQVSVLILRKRNNPKTPTEFTFTVYVGRGLYSPVDSLSVSSSALGSVIVHRSRLSSATHVPRSAPSASLIVSLPLEIKYP